MNKFTPIFTSLVIVLIINSLFAQSQFGDKQLPVTDDTDTVFIPVEDCEIRIPAPEYWIIDLENAAHDNYTAAIHPDTQNYFENNMIVYLWVFSLDSIGFADFVYVQSDPGGAVDVQHGRPVERRFDQIDHRVGWLRVAIGSRPRKHVIEFDIDVLAPPRSAEVLPQIEVDDPVTVEVDA